MERWLEAGFTQRQAEALDSAFADLVTKDYLREELQHFKRSILLWVVAMLAPVYAALVYLTMKVG